MLSCIDTVFTGMLGGERPGIGTVNVLGLSVASKYASADMQLARFMPGSVKGLVN